MQVKGLECATFSAYHLWSIIITLSHLRLPSFLFFMNIMVNQNFYHKSFTISFRFFKYFLIETYPFGPFSHFLNPERQLQVDTSMSLILWSRGSCLYIWWDLPWTMGHVFLYRSIGHNHNHIIIISCCRGVIKFIKTWCTCYFIT